MKEILAIVEDNAGNVIALNTADGDLPLSNADRCNRAVFERRSEELVAKLGGDPAPFKRDGRKP